MKGWKTIFKQEQFSSLLGIFEARVFLITFINCFIRRRAELLQQQNLLSYSLPHFCNWSCRLSSMTQWCFKNHVECVAFALSFAKVDERIFESCLVFASLVWQDWNTLLIRCRGMGVLCVRATSLPVHKGLVQEPCRKAHFGRINCAHAETDCEKGCMD